MNFAVPTRKKDEHLLIGCDGKLLRIKIKRTPVRIDKYKKFMKTFKAWRLSQRKTLKIMAEELNISVLELSSLENGVYTTVRRIK